MSDDKDICGAETAQGNPCSRPMGWGTDSDLGPCKDHTDNSTNRGRPTKFDDERARAAIRAAREGKSEAGAARAAAVAPNTINNWKDRNPTFEAESGEEREFLQAFMRARSEGESKLVNGGLRNDDVDSSMAKFLLSTSFDYVKTERTELTGEDGGAIEVESDVVEVTEDDLSH